MVNKKNKKRKARSPRKPLFSTKPENKLADLPVTLLTESLGMMQGGMLDEALELVDKHLQTQTADGLAFHLKGLILHRLKRYDLAIMALNQSIELGPAEASWFMNLGISIRATGDLNNAIVQFEKAMAMDADYKPVDHQMAMTLFDKGEGCRSQGALEQAIELLEHAMTYDENEPDISHALAVMYDDFGKVKKAIALQKQTLAKNPDHDDSRLHLSQMLRLSGSLDEAHKQLNQLPNSPNKRIAQAQIQHIQGQDEPAWMNLQQLPHEVYDDINYLSVYAQLAPKYHQIDRAIQQLHVGLNQNRKPGEQALLHYYLQKLYDITGDYDRAFDHARYANSFKPGVFDAIKHRGFVSHLLKQAGKPSSQNNEKRPLFIVGMPRSGTSLVEQILGRHSQVHPAGELNYISTFAEQLQKHHQYPESGPVTLEGATQGAKLYQQALDNLSTKTLWITDKMPTNFLHLGLIAQMFPHARIIHCTRDPLDTCLSCYFQNFGIYHAYSQRLDWLCDYYQQYQKLMAHWQTTLPLEMMDISYEALVQDPEPQIKKLLEFAGLDWDERCLSPHESDRTVVTASNQQVREPIYQRSVKRWENYKQHIAQLMPLAQSF